MPRKQGRVFPSEGNYVQVRNERSGATQIVQNAPMVLSHWRALGYTVDIDPDPHPFKPGIPWRFDPTMPTVPRTATRFKGRFS